MMLSCHKPYMDMEIKEMGINLPISLFYGFYIPSLTYYPFNSVL